MEFPYRKRSSSSPASAQNSIGSERLRKAIERNRRKQAKRTLSELSSEETNCVVEKSWTPPRFRQKSPALMANSKRKSAVSSTSVRRGVAKSEATFTTALRETPRKSPAKVSYAKSPRSIRQQKAFSSVFQNYLVKGVWVFCGFLALRLIFSNGGVLDYYSRKEILTLKIREHNRIIEDNKRLVEEIEKIKKDSQYQKKLVRDHLGFIASDEYLILFAKDSQKKSI